MFAAVLGFGFRHARHVHVILVHNSHMARLTNRLMFTHVRLHHAIADAYISCSNALQRY